MRQKIDCKRRSLIEKSNANLTYLFDSWVEKRIGNSCHCLASSIFLESIAKEGTKKNIRERREKKRER